MSIADYKKIGAELLKQHIDFIPFSEVLTRGIDELQATDPDSVFSFGYDWLDNKMTGIFPGELVLIGGESGTGKTTFATNIMYKSSRKHKCAVLALEDRLNEYAIRALYFEIGRIRKKDGRKNYPWNDYRKNSIDDSNYSQYREDARKNITNENLYFGDVKQQMDVDMLEAAIRKQVENGIELFLIDHLHYFDLLKGEASKADYIESVMVRMKTILRNTGARIILVAHYKKLNGVKPTMDAFKDSIAIVQNSNYVINMWRDRTLQEGEELMEQRYDTKIMVPKSRNPNGEFTVDVRFDPETNDFTNPKTSYGTPTETVPTQITL